jgi:hypothetical protein
MLIIIPSNLIQDFYKAFHTTYAGLLDQWDPMQLRVFNAPATRLKKKDPTIWPVNVRRPHFTQAEGPAA